ncbi:MAG: AAA family ATPase [Clostridiales bacterium]|nr:AAA family ATPase [Clostridiales bacterium]
MENIKINQLEIENVKRIKAVKITPSKNGLTVIGGDNNQGKTSVLDAITWALGGEKYRPTQPGREGSATPPYLHITMNNGLVVERKGKNSSLKVTDPSGDRAGQQLLDEFVSKLALDLPKFMEASGKEKADTLLKIIGVGDQLDELNRKEKELYNERLYVGRTADQKEKFANEQPYYPDAPQDLVSPSELIRQQQEILARNGENQRKREQVREYEAETARLRQEVEDLKSRLERKEDELISLNVNLTTAKRDAKDLQDESTAKLEESIANIDEINRKVRANLDKEKARDDANSYREQYQVLSSEIEEVRKEKAALLSSADLPLTGLSVSDGELVYNGQQWDNMSGSDRLKVSTAIVRKLNPKCGFVLLDKLEQMDLGTLREFGLWLEEEGLQAIATRVSTGGECSVIIEDGYVKDADPAPEPKAEAAPKWRGDF